MAFNPRQYEVGEPFFGGADANIVAKYDQMRIQSYNLYEDIYDNNQNSLKILLRGDDSLPIYMPSGKKIVHATDRYLGKNIDYIVEPDGTDGNPVDEGVRQYVDNYMKNLYAREAVGAKFASSKKLGLVRADAAFLIVGDPNKPDGSKLSVHEVDPRTIFAIDHPTDPNRIAGWHLVERVIDFREKDNTTTKQIARRTTWRKEINPLGVYTGKVLHSVTHWEIGKWDDRVLLAADLEQIIDPINDLEELPLPDPISELPIYLWNNDPPQSSSWGKSMLAGFETLIFAINQSLSDEDLTLVMRGLGMYVTNAARPINDAGQILDWNVGPGQVIEISTDQEFTNVAGVSDVSPYQDHMVFMDEKGLSEAAGVPAVAIGKVDVQVAESGISLQLQLDPLIAANADRELNIIVTMNQFHHDLVQMWIPAYEKFQTGTCVVSTVFDDPMPENKAETIQNLVLLRTSNLILTSMVVDKLSSMGWEYPAGMSIDEIVSALEDQAKSDSTILMGDQSGLANGGFDQNGDPIPPPVVPPPVDKKTVQLGVS